MKKLIAVLLSILVVCTAFTCFAGAADDSTVKDSTERGIEDLITNILDGHQGDHREEAGNGLKFFRIIFENLTNFAKNLAEAFDKFVERVKSFSTENVFDRLADMFKR